MRLPLLSYPLTREVNAPWLSVLVYGTAFLALIVLIILNTALTAYEVILTTTNDYYAVQKLWYHRFSGYPKPGTLCASYNFTVGEQLTTTSNLFRYTLLGINGSRPALAYAGTPLSNCDVMSGSLSADLGLGLLNAILYIGCDAEGLPIVAKAEHSESWFGYLSTRADSTAVDRFFDPEAANAFDTQTKGTPENLIDFGMTTTTWSLKEFFVRQLTIDPANVPVKFSIEVIPACSTSPYWAGIKKTYCREDNNTRPAQWIYNWDTGYLLYGNGSEVAKAPITGFNVTGPNNYISINSYYDTPSLNYSSTYLPYYNDFLQLFAEAVRLDWGSVHQNNPFINAAIVPSIISNQTLAREIQREVQKSGPGGNDFYGMQAFQSGKPTYLNAQYLCRFLYRTNWARGLVNVVVATFSILSAGWGFAMLAVAFLFRRRPEDYYCAGHAHVALYQGQPADLFYSHVQPTPSTPPDGVGEKA